MNLQEIALSSTSLQLPHCLNERRTLDITNRTSQLDYTHIRRLISVIDWNLCNPLNPILNCVCKMRHNLDRLSKVIAPTLTFNDVLVYLAGCDVILAREGNIEVALVVSEIEVDFSTVVEDKDFSVSGTKNN